MIHVYICIFCSFCLFFVDLFCFCLFQHFIFLVIAMIVDFIC